MYGREARRLGRALLYVGLLPVVLFALGFLSKSLLAFLAWPALAAAVVAVILLLWVGYRLWRDSQGTAAARFMKWGFILGLGIPAASIVIDNVILLFVSSHLPLFIERTWGYKVVALVPMLLFAIGLSRVDWVPRWIPRFGYAWLALSALSETPLFSALPKIASGAINWAVTGLQVAAYIGLALALLSRSRLEVASPEVEESAGGRAEQALPAGGGYAAQ